MCFETAGWLIRNSFAAAENERRDPHALLRHTLLPWELGLWSGEIHIGALLVAAHVASSGRCDRACRRHDELLLHLTVSGG